MKTLLFSLFLGVSCVAVAATVPEKDASQQIVQVRKAKIRRTNMANHKVMVDKLKLQARTDGVSQDFLTSEDTTRLRKMPGVVNKENVKAVDTIARLANDNPELLAYQLFGAKPGEVEWPTRAPNRLGSDEMAEGARRAVESDDPLEMLATIRMPELTGTYEELEAGGDAIEQAHKEAMVQIQELSHEHLGQKPAPIFMKP